MDGKLVLHLTRWMACERLMYEEIILVSQRLPRSWHFQGRNSAMEAWCQFDQKYSVRSLWTHSVLTCVSVCANM